MKIRRSYFLLGTKIVLSVLLLWVVLSRFDAASVVARVKATDLRWLLSSVALGPASVLLSAWRWRELSLGLLTLGEAVRYTWIGLFFGSVLPGLVGGDVAKGISLATKDPRARDSRLPVSIVVDKLVGFWVLLLFFNLVGLLLLATQPHLFGNIQRPMWITAGVTLIGLIAGAGICHPRGATFFATMAARAPSAALRGLGEKIVAALASYRGQGRILLRAVAASALLHALNVLFFWLVMHSLHVPATLWFAATFYPLLSGLLALPVSVSGVGVRDVFSASIFTAFGLNPESGVALSWLLLGLSLPNVLIGGAIQLFEIFRRRSKS